MKKLLIILFLFASSLVSAQTGWQFSDPTIQGKITFENGYQLYDSASNGLKLTGNLFLTGSKIILGSNMEIRDSSGYSIFNRTPIFRNAIPWITANDLKDTIIPISKIKKGQLTADMFTPTLKDSIFGNTSVGDISRTVNDINTRYSTLFNAKGDFKSGVFSGSILTYDTNTKKINFDSTKLIASSEAATFFKYSDTVNFLSVTDINDSLFKITGGKLGIKPGSITPSKLDASKLGSTLQVDGFGNLTVKPGSILPTDLDSSKFSKGLKLTGDKLDLNIPGTLKDTLGAYYQKETIFLTWADTATHYFDAAPEGKFMSTVGHEPDSIGYVLPRAGYVKSVTIITAAGIRKKVTASTPTAFKISPNEGLSVFVWKTSDGAFTDYDAIQLCVNGLVNLIFYPDENVDQLYTTFTTGTNKVIVEVQLEPF